MKKLKIASEVYSKKIQGQWVIVKKNSQYSYELNESAGLMWETLENPRTKHELVKILLSAYKIDQNTANQDVEKFIDFCNENGLLEDV